MIAPSFETSRRTIADGAARGIAAAAAALKGALRGAGEDAAVSNQADGTVHIVIPAANARAREFGTLTQPAQPFLGPFLQENRAMILEQIGKSIAAALSEKRP